MVRFDVLIEDKSGKHIAVFEGVPAQTRSEAVNKVKQMLTFTAERENKDCADKAERPEIPQHSNR